MIDPARQLVSIVPEQVAAYLRGDGLMKIGPVRILWRDRLFEWLMALAMLLMALEIAVWPSTIKHSVFIYILEIISAQNLGLFFMVFGVLRMTALFANGAWPKYGPWMRSMGAGAGAFMWTQMNLALFLFTIDTRQIPSLGIPIYTVLMIGEIVSAYRSISDARPST